jgi:uncharacterized membrane protein
VNNEENQSNEHFIEQHMYENRASKFRPLLTMLWMVLLGLGFAAFSVFIYQDLAKWEQTGGTKRMNSLLILIYNLGGKTAVAGLFVAFALLLVFGGINTWRKNRQSQL